MTNDDSNRFQKYESAHDISIIENIPVIIKINGKLFQKTTQNVTKPFCYKTMALFGKTMMSMSKEVDGIVFGYHYDDKIILVLQNNKSLKTNPWFGNKIQKIGSTASSMVSSFFMNHLLEMKEPPQIEGNIIFNSHVFSLPNINEVVSYLIYRQSLCKKKAIDSIIYSKLKEENIYKILENKTLEDRMEIIKSSGMNIDKFPIQFFNGICLYSIPRITKINGEEITKKKWEIDFEYGLFSERADSLRTIIKTGSDIFRPERDL